MGEVSYFDYRLVPSALGLVHRQTGLFVPPPQAAQFFSMLAESPLLLHILYHPMTRRRQGASLQRMVS
jgi:hypothetical protein